MVELIIYPKSKNIEQINMSPFCSKTEIFLKLANIDYEINNYSGDPGKFSKGKLPVIKYKDRLIEDSGFIQKFLEHEFKVDLDGHLSSKEKAQGFAYTKMIEQYLYWSVLHERWFIDENWANLRDNYFGNIPKLVRGLITNRIRKKIKASAVGHGMARHTDTEVMDSGYECIQVISDILGENNYIMGDKVSSYDSTVYAFISGMLYSPLGPKFKDRTLQYSNLVAYDKRMFNLMSF